MDQLNRVGPFTAFVNNLEITMVVDPLISVRLLPHPNIYVTIFASTRYLVYRSLEHFEKRRWEEIIGRTKTKTIPAFFTLTSIVTTVLVMVELKKIELSAKVSVWATYKLFPESLIPSLSELNCGCCRYVLKPVDY